MNFGDLKTEQGIKKLNGFLGDHSYIDGFKPTQADVTVFEALGKAPASTNQHVCRWYNHIKTFDMKSLPDNKVPVSQNEPATKKEEDDDVDLFASDDENDEEAEKIKQQRISAYAVKKSNKPALIAKSSIILDVKPWDDETSMKVLEENVRKIEMDGLVWGASKLLPVGFGIKKLQIICVVEDDKVSVDELQELIAADEANVQSVDIAAFNKI